MEEDRLKTVVLNLASQFPMSDPRLQHIVTYLIHCDCTNDMVQLILMEQFGEIIHEHSEKYVLL